VQVHVTIDCTPQEARGFLGLPDLTPLHDVYLDKMKSFAGEGVKPEDVERLYRAWGTGLSEGLEQWQRLFWRATSEGPTSTR